MRKLPPRYFFIWILFALTIFGFAIIYENYRSEQFVQITKSYADTIHVNYVYVNHGKVIFNSKYCVCTPLKNSSDEILDLFHLPENTILTKIRNSDSIILTKPDNEKVYLVLKDYHQ